MMRKLQFSVFAMVIMALVGVGFASCGSDDEDDRGEANGGSEKVITPNGRIIVDGKEYKVNYGYWDYDHQGSQTKYFLEFTEKSFESGFQSGSGTYMQIQFYADGSSRTLPTGDFTPTYVEVIAKSEAYEMYSDVMLKIERMGDTYTFTLSGKAATHGSNDFSKDMTFTFNGKIAYLED